MAVAVLVHLRLQADLHVLRLVGLRCLPNLLRSAVFRHILDGLLIHRPVRTMESPSEMQTLRAMVQTLLLLASPLTMLMVLRQVLVLG